MKKKLVKALLAATLVLSILGTNFSYVGARNVKEGSMSGAAEEATTDVVENEELEGVETEEVKPEENMLPETENVSPDESVSSEESALPGAPLPETEMGDNHTEGETQAPNSEMAEGENVEAVESEPAEETKEEEIPEITDESLLNNRDSRAENRVNFDDVCRGGGNPNNTDKPNQDPGKQKIYWDFNDDSFRQVLSEEDLINKFWPRNRGEALNHTFTIPNAVIEPDYQCFYANKQNGFGESVSPSEFKQDFYYKYNQNWINVWGDKWTPRPTGSQRDPQTGKPLSPPDYNDLRYTGNYLWKNNSGGYLFTIVTRPKLKVGLNGHYTDPQTGKSIGQYYIGGNSHPRVFDVTGTRDWEHDPKTSMYRFKGITTKNTFYSIPGKEGYNNSTDYRKTPTIPGKYKMTVQVKEDVSQFILPGIWEEEVIYMNRGYRTKFVQRVDGANEKELTEADWNSGQKPDPFDKNTKDLFGIDLYLQDTNYKIPIPKYDENKYIFEGWQVEEQYWNERTAGYPHGYITTKTKELNINHDGTYTYRPTTIDANQYFVLEAKLIAKFRTRKTNTVNVSLNFINDESGLDEEQKATVSISSIKLVEKINNEEEFVVNLKDKPFDFMGYGKNKDGTHPLETNIKWKPGAADSVVLPDNQIDVNNETQIYATITAKPITIKLDPNGGHVKSRSKQTENIETYYYKNTQISTDKFENKDLVLKGWSETKGGDVKVTNGGFYKVDDLKVEGKYPSEKTLYAVWGKKTATVEAKKHKDILFYPTASRELAANSIYAEGSKEINAYELGRFYLNVELANPNASMNQAQLDPTKFKVVIEHSKDGNNWKKLELNDYSKGAIVTAAFSDNTKTMYSKVVYDDKKQKWFVPLLGRVSKMNDENSYKGFYRVNVAYDDDAAAEEVTTEQGFIAGNGNKGWSESNQLQVRVVQSPDAFINVPSAITLEEGTTEEIIESVHSSNKVTVVPFEHDDQKMDYDWLTPNNALVENRTGSYNNQMHEEFIKNKPFFVSIDWDQTLTDSTSRYTIDNIQMYSAANINTMKKDEVIPKGTTNSFIYDATNDNKTLFDFYLKGDKPKGLPNGVQLKGTITFTVSPEA